MPEGVRVKRSRATVLQVHYLDAGDPLANEADVSAAYSELGVPDEQDAVPQPVS
ncbi:hypothetical protein [Microbacterium arborescens]|uniref:hypothetical protein n=1 Tax=Microbacterium arborescens TaxID=33883 RepID=UPI0027861F58|nr:hypothetical protein [Microbacterium arborescens]MDQ1215816.1 hypothetical protein [Microbacterium arborescens]